MFIMVLVQTTQPIIIHIVYSTTHLIHLSAHINSVDKRQTARQTPNAVLVLKMMMMRR